MVVMFGLMYFECNGYYYFFGFDYVFVSEVMVVFEVYLDFYELVVGLVRLCIENGVIVFGSIFVLGYGICVVLCMEECVVLLCCDW